MNSQSSVLRTALPLASLTAVGLLATDLYLPAVPQLPVLLNGTIPQSQLTLASFNGALAISQLVWGWASDRCGERRILTVGILLLFFASLMCAVSSSMELLILGRALQGFGAGAATTIVPAVLKKKILRGGHCTFNFNCWND